MPHHIIESYMIHRKLLKIRDDKLAHAEEHADRGVFYHELEYPDSAQARPLFFTSTIVRYASFMQHNTAALAIERFLKGMRMHNLVRAVHALSHTGWTQAYLG